MGLAVAGIAIGVIVSVIWFVIAFGVQKGIQQYTAFGQVISDIDSDSYDSARGMLTRESRTLATDELMAEFKAAYQADAGSIKEWPKGLTGVFGTFMDLGKQGQQPDNSQVPYPSSMPLPGMFDSGNRIVWVIIDQQGQLGETGNLPAIINVAVQASDGSLIWLIDPDVQRAGAQLVPSGGETETPEGDAAPEQVSPADDDGEG